MSRPNLGKKIFVCLKKFLSRITRALKNFVSKKQLKYLNFWVNNF